jgi:serine carboxypeptidase 1
MRLMGFAMGNSWISPIDSTLTWGHLLYQMSLVDEAGEKLIVEEAMKAQAAIDQENWVLATRYWGSTEGVVIDQTNGVDFYDILKFEDYGLRRGSMMDVDEMRIGLKGRIDDRLYDKVFKPAAGAKLADSLDELMNGPIREYLEIIPDNVRWGGQSGPVFTFQEGDFMKPVVHDVDLALQETDLKVIVYQGQLDLICLTKGAMDWVQQLTWENMDNYYRAERKPFVRAEDKQTEMYVKAFNRFKFYWVLGAGHAVPKDNGWTAYRMLERILADLDV